MASAIDRFPVHPDGLIFARDVAAIHGRRDHLSRACQRGELVRIHHGVYVDAERWSDLKPWQRFTARSRAAGLADSRVTLSHASALAIHGCPLLFSDRPVEALVAGVRRGHRTPHIHYRGTGHPDAFTEIVDGVTITSLARSLAEFAARSTVSEAVVALDWALRPSPRNREERVTRDEVRDAADAVSVTRGRRRLEFALAFADERSESAGESYSRVLIAMLGFVAPDLQHVISLDTGGLARVDFRWPGQRLVGEFDGLDKYRSAEMRQGKSAGEVVMEEKRREDAIRRAGEGVARWEWWHLYEPARLATVLTRAGVPRRHRTPMSAHFHPRDVQVNAG